MTIQQLQLPATQSFTAALDRLCMDDRIFPAVAGGESGFQRLRQMKQSQLAEVLKPQAQPSRIQPDLQAAASEILHALMGAFEVSERSSIKPTVLAFYIAPTIKAPAA